MTDELNTENLSPEDKEALYDYINKTSSVGVGTEDKPTVHSFLWNVAKTTDTTKVAYLKEEEIGIAKYSVRALKDFALISRDIIDNDLFAQHFRDEAETIVLAPSLSREGFLDKLSITTTKQIADITKKPRTENKGWFKKKDPKPEGVETA